MTLVIPTRSAETEGIHCRNPFWLQNHYNRLDFVCFEYWKGVYPQSYRLESQA